MPLTVYKASAGSGKTFTLAVEYISLLILNPSDYEHILAVTFTNKATEEMKMRIISQLYGISKDLEDSDIYINKVMEKTGKDRATIIRHAGIALDNLIHHYSYFRVQTIDAFFQTVFRNLARELDLPPNLRVELDDKQIEERAVDELINSLDKQADVLRWINEYIDKNISDDKSWNVIDSIKQFGNNIFKDFYKQQAEALDEKMKSEKFFQSYTRLLRQIIESTRSAFLQQAQKMLTLLQQSGFDDKDHFKYGASSVFGYIHKQAALTDISPDPVGAHTQAFIDDPAAMIKTPEAVDFATTVLHPALVSYEATRQKAWYDIQSAQQTLSHLNQLRLLHAIAATVDEMCKTENRFQLSNTQTLLHHLMSDTDTPFVYEKIGAQLHHIMIDEFQDTGRIQWTNFKKLLNNCLAMAESHNLIVGDVKQSIYRWRSGDWRLLNDIASEFSPKLMTQVPLSVNRRSEEIIVEFNNAFFQEAVNVTLHELNIDAIPGADQLARAYHATELVQEPSRKSGRGYVEICLLPNKSEDNDVLSLLGDSIDRLVSNGAAPSDIAILVRRNTEGEQIADYLTTTRPDLPISSNEAFRMDSSQAVNIIIDALRLLVAPDDIVKAQLVKNYQLFVLQSGLTDTDLLVCDHPEEFLPESFLAERERLIMLPFLDLVDELYRIFSVGKIPNQSAYICALYDRILEFMRESTPSVESFLKEWDSTLCARTIQSDVADGIRIITLHKSKGLEFNHVLMPYCNWKLEMDGNIIWCKGNKPEPYNALPLIPVSFSKKKMMGTVFEQDYKDEHFQNVVDNMNLLYVAFTRASKSLHIISSRVGQKKNNTQTRRGEVLQLALPGVVTALERFHPEYEEAKGVDGVTHFTIGNYDSIFTETKARKVSDNVFLCPVNAHPIQIESFASTASFRQSNRSTEFVTGEDESPTKRLTYIKLGNVLHQLFSHMKTLDDIAPLLRNLELEGVIYDQELSKEELLNKIYQSLNDPQVKSWFSGDWTLYNECTIIDTDNQTGLSVEHRPDRVMSNGKDTIVVDFKFGVPRQEYRQQVSRYMSLLTKMGHPHVKGYLWYVLQDKVEAI